MIKTYELWGIRMDRPSAFFPADTKNKQQLFTEPECKLLDEIQAHTWEEACSIYHIRVGFEPYKPSGKAVPCPNKCGALYYPEGSGECPRCGSIG